MNEPGPSAATMPPQVSYDWLQRRIVFAAVAFALALLAVQAFQAWHGYRTARTEAERRAANLVYILSAHMQEAVAALDASLVQIAAASARLGGPSGDADDWNAVLMGAIAGLLNTGSLSVTDSQGVIPACDGREHPGSVAAGSLPVPDSPPPSECRDGGGQTLQGCVRRDVDSSRATAGRPG